jgi:hypothetical protein
LGYDGPCKLPIDLAAAWPIRFWEEWWDNFSDLIAVEFGKFSTLRSNFLTRTDFLILQEVALFSNWLTINQVRLPIKYIASQVILL